MSAFRITLCLEVVAVRFAAFVNHQANSKTTGTQIRKTVIMIIVIMVMPSLTSCTSSVFWISSDVLNSHATTPKNHFEKHEQMSGSAPICCKPFLSSKHLPLNP